MIQYPKNCHVTLPSVEMWGTNMNILRDPPKALYTRKIDKVGDNSDLTKYIGEDSGDRICEMIKVYPRGIDPFGGGSYNNYGTNGGIVRYSAGGSETRNLLSSASAVNQQTKYPYRVVRDGVFRPPVQGPRDLLPLSRQPRVWTYAFANPAFPNFAKQMECPSIVKGAKTDNEMIRTCIRPTAVFNVEGPITEPFAITQVIDNPIHIQAHSGMRTMDLTQQHVISPVKEIIEEPTHYSMTANVKSNINKSGDVNLDTERYIQNPNHYTVSSKVQQNIQSMPLIDVADIDIHIKDIPTITYTTPATFQKQENYIHQDLEFERRIPEYQASTNISQNIHKRFDSEMAELDRKRPLADVYVNQGGHRGTDEYENSSREYRLHPTLNYGGFEGKGLKTRIERDENKLPDHTIDPNKMALSKRVMNQFEGRYESNNKFI